MELHTTAGFTTTIQWIAPVVVAIALVSFFSLLKEPNRRTFNAIFIAGAGAAYLSGGGLGVWEVAFNALMLIPAYKGLRSYRWIGIGWLLHTGWDIVHHLYGNPILPFDPTSSLGCAVCDPVLALWCFTGGPSLFELIRGRHTVLDLS